MILLEYVYRDFDAFIQGTCLGLEYRIQLLLEEHRVAEELLLPGVVEVVVGLQRRASELLSNKYPDSLLLVEGEALESAEVISVGVRCWEELLHEAPEGGWESLNLIFCQHMKCETRLSIQLQSGLVIIIFFQK